MFKQKLAQRTGLTLIELVVVLLIMTAVASIIIPIVDFQIATSTGEKSPEQIVTLTTMNNIRDVLMGTEQRQGVWEDIGFQDELFPREVSDLLLDWEALQNKYLGDERLAPLERFNPVTNRGWRGPYFAGRMELVDGWGNELEIVSPRPGCYQLVSVSPDGDPMMVDLRVVNP